MMAIQLTDSLLLLERLAQPVEAVENPFAGDSTTPLVGDGNGKDTRNMPVGRNK